MSFISIFSRTPFAATLAVGASLLGTLGAATPTWAEEINFDDMSHESADTASLEDVDYANRYFYCELEMEKKGENGLMLQVFAPNLKPNDRVSWTNFKGVKLTLQVSQTSNGKDTIYATEEVNCDQQNKVLSCNGIDSSATFNTLKVDFKTHYQKSLSLGFRVTYEKGTLTLNKSIRLGTWSSYTANNKTIHCNVSRGSRY